MNNIAFLWPNGDYEKPIGDAELTVLLSNGTSETIDNISIQQLDERCPLLALAFEPSRNRFSHSIEDTTPSAVASVLRYAYLGHYIPPNLEGFAKSFLLHLHIYHLATMYDIAELADQAATEIMLECEISCSSPLPPIDLVPAIEFLYSKLFEHARLRETIVNYCISCFLYHGLHQEPEFRRVAYSLRPFQKDLCRTNMERGFADEGNLKHSSFGPTSLTLAVAAFEIISLPFEPFDGSANAASKALGDYLFEFFGGTDRNSITSSRAESIVDPDEHLRFPPVPLSLPAKQSSKPSFSKQLPMRLAPSHEQPSRSFDLDSESKDDKDGLSALAAINQHPFPEHRPKVPSLGLPFGYIVTETAAPAASRSKPLSLREWAEQKPSTYDKLERDSTPRSSSFSSWHHSTFGDGGSAQLNAESDTESFDMVSLDSDSVRYTPPISHSGDESDDFVMLHRRTSTDAEIF